MFRIVTQALVAGYLVLSPPALAQMAAASTDSAASTASDAPYYLEGRWTYSDVGPVGKAVDGYPPGKMAMDCQVGADGHLTACDLTSVTPGGLDAAQAIIRVFMAYTHVDPASIPGGIKPGARKKFIYSWS